MRHGSLFSGIGGFDLAAEWMGWENVFHCEWNPFCQAVLKYYWPNATTYNDITTTDFTIWKGRVDILTGGFPCQPFSTAGQRKGTSDDRYLWPEMLRAIREIKPRYVVGENVDGIFTWSDGMVFETVCADLENEGYEVQPYRIPACATGAPHRRDRWWFVAHARSQSTECELRAISNERRTTSQDRTKGIRQGNGPTCTGRTGAATSNVTHPHSQRQPQPQGLVRKIGGRAGNEVGDAPNPNYKNAQRRSFRKISNSERWEVKDGYFGECSGTQWSEYWIEAATRLCILDDGLPGRLDAQALSTKPQHAAGKWRKESLKAAGNAIVPQIAHAIFQAIEQTEISIK